MRVHEHASATIEAELSVSAATARLVHFHLPEPVDDIVLDREEGAYRIDLCLTPRPHDARGCYRDRWGPHRFERIGQVFVLPPGETLQARSDSSHQTSLVCDLRIEPIAAWLHDADLRWPSRALEASLDVSDANVRRLLLRLADELRHPGFEGPLLVELIAVQLAIELSRYCMVIAERPTTGRLSPWRLKRIDERLHEVREAPTLSELAALCGLSVRQLTRTFRATRGCSIGDYVALVRIDHARRLLAMDQSIKEIAYTLGFSSPSRFAFAFRRATGESPGEFRQRTSRDA